MSSHSHTSAVLVVFMALAVGVGAEPLTEKSCDVVGDESTESQMEKALLKKLEPLSQIRYDTSSIDLLWTLGSSAQYLHLMGQLGGRI